MNHIKRQDGFTLIEIIVTLCILSIVIVPISSMFVMSARNNVRSSIEFEASLIAQKYMEEIKSWDVEKKYDKNVMEGKFYISIDLSPVEGEKFKKKLNVKNSNEYDMIIKYSNKKIYIDDTLILTNKDHIKMTFDDRACYIDDIKVMSLIRVSDPTIKIESDKDFIINIINERDDDVKLYTDKNSILNVSKGYVEKNVNVKDYDMKTESEYILYKIQVSVYYERGLITMMEGYKVFK